MAITKQRKSDGTTALVPEYPKCCLCPDEAHFDCKIAGGSWGYVCDAHFLLVGGPLGIGRGQRLVLRREDMSYV